MLRSLFMHGDKSILPQIGESDTKNIWGPKYWKLLHDLTKQYPDHPTYNDMRIATNEIMFILLSLPCPKCVQHAVGYYMSNPPILTNNYTLQRWGYEFHNSVNKRTGAPQYDWLVFYSR